MAELVDALDSGSSRETGGSSTLLGRISASKPIVLIANGEPPSQQLLEEQRGKVIIALDGGLAICHRYGLKPAFLLGDFDSISAELRNLYADLPQIELPDQNKCDLEKALELLMRLSPLSITVCAALGKRLDHTLVNVCLLCRYPDRVKFETDHEISFVLPKTVHLQCKKEQTLSLIPLSSEVLGVTTEGLKWELREATLNKSFFSLSNRCVAEEISIRHAAGDLLLCLIKD
jgi:thiamine pyrophosphokinase